MSSYYDNWRETSYTCTGCGWGGLGKELTHGESFRDLFEVDCPACGKTLGTVTYPTVAESRANWEQVSPEDRLAVELFEARRAAFQLRLLRAPDQLPDLQGDDLILVWDYTDDNDHETILKYGNQELWREPAVYEGYERYLEVLEILSQKYGGRLQDLVPTRASELYLYGDALKAPGIVREQRDRLRRRGKA
jgi:hypothetical protein